MPWDLSDIEKCGWLNILTPISLFYFNPVLITNNERKTRMFSVWGDCWSLR